MTESLTPEPAYMFDADHGARPYEDRPAATGGTRGITFWHRIPVAPHQTVPGWCVGSCPLDGAAPWQLLAGDFRTGEGLTLAPSVACLDHTECHGFIRDGKWVPC